MKLVLAGSKSSRTYPSLLTRLAESATAGSSANNISDTFVSIDDAGSSTGWKGQIRMVPGIYKQHSPKYIVQYSRDHILPELASSVDFGRRDNSF